jgi:hypothetical protein
MRARELLDEDYNQNLNSAIGNVLEFAKAREMTEIPMDALVSKLQASGFSVSPGSLMTLLQGNVMVTNVTPDSVTLDSGEAGPLPSQDQDQGQDSAEHVSDLAQDATDIK